MPNRFQISALTACLAFSLNANPALAHKKHLKDLDQNQNQNQNQGQPPAPTERIILMRHAEKPADDKNPDLTDVGYQRAKRLAVYIPSQYGRPDYIFAATNSSKSRRPLETATPLSQATGVPVDTSFKDKDYKGLAEALVNDPKFAGKFIVVVWHHKDIPQFAHKLGAKEGTYPPEWPVAVYNQLLQFQYTGKHHPLVNQVREPF